MNDDHPKPRDTISYDSDADEYRAEFVSPVHSPSSAVVEVIAATADRDPLQMEPLHRKIDPDALNTLVSTNLASQYALTLQVSFAHEGHQAIVHSHGLIRVRNVD